MHYKYQEFVRQAKGYQKDLDLIYGNNDSISSNATVAKSSQDLATSSSLNSGILDVLFTPAYANELEQEEPMINRSKPKPWLTQYGEMYYEAMQDDYEHSLATINTLGNVLFDPRTQGIMQTTLGIGQVDLTLT